MSDAIGAELAQLAREVWAWQSETFGDAMTVHGAVAKICDECAEVLLTEGDAARREELADVFFMLVQLVGVTGGDPSSAMATPFTPSSEVKAGMYRMFSETPIRLLGIIAAESIGMTGGPCSHWQASVLALPWAALCFVTGDVEHMPAAIRAKLEENRGRTWAKPAADGTISHVKGGE